MLPDIKRRFGISRIGVFGSEVSGNPSPGSDIDILISF
ncbi:MAG TPA: nucleotidyltransferase domain-containing protein, partial [Methanospirillum sp.]|nr:nucleotidyltransferase domain-containing protein [Methanospirillum sp.]